ncbi:MAG: hypothetical protein WCH39_15140 [Schlesneria sp.]
MRRGSWILAISGMMALHQSGYAADPVADQSAGRTAVGTAGTSAKPTAKRPVKKPDASASAGAKNYYKDLFGEDGPSPDPVAKPIITASAPAKSDSTDWADEPVAEKPVTAAKTPTKKAKADFEEPSLTDLPTVSDSHAAATAAKEKANQSVAQANYNKPAGKKIPVQQIRSDSRPKSAPPVAEFDETTAKTTRKPAAKQKEQIAAREESFDSDANTRTTAIETAPVKTGPQTPQVTLEWFKKGEFNVGQECQAELVVKNTGSTAVTQIAIDAVFPTNVRLTAAEPKPASATDRLTWNIEQLEAGSEKKITVKMIPSRRGDIGATAQVRFTGTSSTAFSVHEPLLKVSVKSPTKEVMLGDPASQMITVTNPGTGTVQDVKVEAKLSAGLEHPTREDRLVIDVGAVGPGETRSYRLGLTAAKGGPQSVTVVATSSSEASSTDLVEFNVVAPSLKIAVEGPSLRYKGRNAKYTMTVTNDGSLVNSNIRVSQVVSDGFKFVAADHGGKYDPSINTIQWFINRLAPGESTQVACELNSLKLGDFTQTVQVVSDSGVQADAQIETRVDGIASLTLELVDLDDPVEVGSETGYEIRVKNEGSKAATGVVVACDLPNGMQFLSAKAPVDQVIEGRQLFFNPIDQIAPGSQVTFRVQMKVTKEGSHRMKARLSGGGLQEPMLLEEVTRAYTDGSN